uniref:Arachidonate lipoxygenase 3 n=1 Tax=Sphenodon punctatus TaxID=8508 RepID=A0A8D0HJR3_SPHPU
MATYKVQVSTGKGLLTGTFDSISITLVGTYGESPKQLLNRIGTDFSQGSLDEYEVESDQELGEILLIRLHKEPYSFFPESSWFCNYVQVTSPQGDLYRFPCYLWLEGYATTSLREGRGKRGQEGPPPPAAEGSQSVSWPVAWDSVAAGPEFSPSNEEETRRLGAGRRNQHAEGWGGRQNQTREQRNFKGPVWVCLSLEYVAQHWKEDAFFGYQYLNGVNPVWIRKCTKIPFNFPVTQDMVAGSLGEFTSLQEELMKGTIFLADYKILEDIPAIEINGYPQYITAQLCLLHQKPSGELIPLAIQLSQTPGYESPIFLPSDSEWIWTLAKTWVRNAEFHVHEVTSHLLRGHQLAEVFAVATLRHLPMCHPLYKLLIPHLRYSVHINVLARTFLVSQGGVFDKAIATGRGGLAVLLKKGLENLTYTTLCLPDDIQARGVDSVLNYYYRDDGLKLWEAVHSFVSGIVGFYYKTNLAVQRDYELQAWVCDIYTKGFLGRRSSGIPSTLRTLEDLIKFVTMVIFTCSAHHAAVNSGQFELGAFMPNSPSSMRKPPPHTKAPVTLEEFLDTIPEMNTTSLVLSILWVLRNEDFDMRPLGSYPDEHFVEDEPKWLITAFQERLAEITKEIEERNKTLTLGYTYLYPPGIENSTAI